MNLMWGYLNYGDVPAEEKDVRNTATPVNNDKPAAEMPHQPTMQEFQSDPDPSLGMAPRQLASAWHQGQQAPPAWAPGVASVSESAYEINRQVSTSGSAANREMAGATNRNLSFAVGIEPVQGLAPGGQFGNDYFVRNPRDVQGTADNSMMSVPPGMDQNSRAQIAAAGKQNARDASEAAMYTMWWNDGR